MSLFGTSRFTAMLATIAILGTVGSFSWAVVIRANLKPDPSARLADRASSSKSASRALRLKDERANKFAPIVKGEQFQLAASGRSDEQDQLRERSVSPRLFVDNSKPSLQDRGPDMPLPAPPLAQSDPEIWQDMFAMPEAIAPQLPGENQRRQVQDLKPEPGAAPTPNSLKPAARSFYIEKLVEQGDAGEVKYRYRRQSCTPPNMPDVCSMPQENRRSIVVERHE